MQVKELQKTVEECTHNEADVWIKLPDGTLVPIQQVSLILASASEDEGGVQTGDLILEVAKKKEGLVTRTLPPITYYSEVK